MVDEEAPNAGNGGEAPVRGEEDSVYIDTIDSDELLDAEGLDPTPERHERLKSGLHGGLFRAIKRADKRYLVIGRGDESGPGKRRRRVCTLLDERPDANAYLLEDFGFSNDELDLWAPAFDVLSTMATYVVGIIEDFDGGHVWELGLLYRYQTHVRDILWLLKRIYGTEEKMRERYDNGMAASHLAALEEAASTRVITWEDPGDIPSAVDKIP